MTPTASTPAPAAFWDCEIPQPPHDLAGPDTLAGIARDAAHRAQALLAPPNDATSPPAPLDPVTDLVRLLHRRTDPELAENAARRAGLRTAELRQLRAAFTAHGPPGVRAALHPLDADPATVHEAADQLTPVRPITHTPLHCERNRITDEQARIQLRLVDGTWYPFTKTPHSGWAPVPGAATLPAAAYTAARRALRNRR